MRRSAAPLLVALAAMLSGAAPATTDAPRAPGEIVAAAPPSQWVAIPPDDLLVMALANGRTVTIELAPRFAPVHVANIRSLVRSGWFDGDAITRVQDDYVAQWGGADPARRPRGALTATPPAEYDRAEAGLTLAIPTTRDTYAPRTGFADGWPVATGDGRAWLPHCYAMVGVGRDMPPDTGSGTELYAVIGHAPRHLDRNIALVGRVIDGIDALSSLPRGTGDLGVYRTAAERTPIRSIRLASDMPVATRPRYERLRTDGTAFAAYADARANRRDAFFVRPAGGADICNIPVPVRRAG